MESKISVIVPVYNAEKYLDGCIKSIIMQSYTNIEIICIDDGSTDRSFDILKRLQTIDERLRIKSVPNGGVSRARNIGIKLATGDYIAFVDSDDYISENYLYELYNELKISKSDLSICKIQNFGSHNEVQSMNSCIFDFNQPEKNIWNKLNFTFLLYGPCNKLYKSEIIKFNKLLFDEKLDYGEDLSFNFEYLNFVNKIVIIDNAIYYYRHESKSSLSKKYRKDRYYNEEILNNKMVNLMKKKNLVNSMIDEYLNCRLFDAAYNSIFDLIRNEKLKIQYIYVKELLKKLNSKIIWEKSLYEKYPNYIIFLMKRKKTLLIIIYLNLRINIIEKYKWR